MDGHPDSGGPEQVDVDRFQNCTEFDRFETLIAE